MTRLDTAARPSGREERAPRAFKARSWMQVEDLLQNRPDLPGLERFLSGFDSKSIHFFRDASDGLLIWLRRMIEREQ